jgi:hypothetical protein
MNWNMKHEEEKREKAKMRESPIIYVLTTPRSFIT